MSDNNHLVQMTLDLQEARSKATFSTESMLHLLRGGPEALAKLNYVRALAEKEPVFDKFNTPFQSRQEVYIIFYLLLYQTTKKNTLFVAIVSIIAYIKAFD